MQIKSKLSNQTQNLQKKKNKHKTKKQKQKHYLNKINNKEDYLKLLPDLPEKFCSKDLEERIGKKNNPNLILWVLSHMNIIKHVESQGRKKIYKII